MIGLDLTPELFDTARRRAAEQGVAVDWVEGDAEDLPVRATSSFDGVALGVRRPVRAAAQVVAERAGARHAGPAGGSALVNWTPEGLIGEMFKIIGRYLPAPPDYASPPPLWGSEEHVRDLFADTRVELDVRPRPQPVAVRLRRALRRLLRDPLRPDGEGPRAAQRRGHAGRSCRGEILALAERRNEATDGSLLMQAEYLVTIGRRPAERLAGRFPATPGRAAPAPAAAVRLRPGSARTAGSGP